MSFVQEREPMLCDDPTLPSELRADFAAYHNVAPPAQARDALFAKLEQSLTTGSVESSRWPRIGLWLVGLSLLGVMAAGLSWNAPPGVTPVIPREQTRSASPASALPASRAPSPSAQPLPAPAVASSISRGERLRAEKRVARTHVEARRKPTPASDLTAELALLTRAKRVLPSDASVALALTREHELKFPHGVFAQEREVLAIEALVRADDKPAALRRAAAFRAAFPRSTHLERLRVVLAEP